MAKLSNTSQTTIAITFLVMNLSALLRQVFWLFLCLFQKRHFFSCFPPVMINKNYALDKNSVNKAYIIKGLASSFIFLNPVFLLFQQALINV